MKTNLKSVTVATLMVITALFSMESNAQRGRPGPGDQRGDQQRPHQKPASADWKYCVGENDRNDVCQRFEDSEIIYGSGTSFTQPRFVRANERTWCDNSVFGDPIVGTVKACYTRPARGPAVRWQVCSAENGVCDAGRGATIRYGANGHYTQERFATGRIACSNTTFGDPAPGLVKQCEIKR